MICSDWKAQPRIVIWVLACLVMASAATVLPLATAGAQETDVESPGAASPGASAEQTADGHANEAEHADDGDHEDSPPLLSLDLGSAFWNLLIFLALLAFLGKFVWPNVLGGLQAREEKIRSDLEAAETTNAKAQSLLAEYQRKLDEAATQVQSMLAEARRDAEVTGQRIVEEAKQEADRQRERALADIDTAKQVAIADIANQTSDLAMQVARSVVGRELKAEDHADLIRQSLDRLPRDH